MNTNLDKITFYLTLKQWRTVRKALRYFDFAAEAIGTEVRPSLRMLRIEDGRLEVGTGLTVKQLWDFEDYLDEIDECWREAEDIASATGQPEGGRTVDDWIYLVGTLRTARCRVNGAFNDWRRTCGVALDDLRGFQAKYVDCTKEETT